MRRKRRLAHSASRRFTFPKNMARTRTPRGRASSNKAAKSTSNDTDQQAATLRASLDAGIVSAQLKLSGMEPGDIKEKKEAAALLEKLLKLRKEFADEKQRPTEIQLIWNTSEDPSDSE